MSDKVKAKPFRQVVDTRGRKIAGIFQRGARYYGRLMVEEKGRMVSRRFPLIDPAGQPVRSPSEAREALELLKDARRRDSLPQANVRPPGYAEWIENFLKSPLRNKRKEWSNYTQQIALGRLGRFFGDTPLNKISATRVREYCEARLAGTLPGEKKLGPVKTQTVNFDLNALRCSLRAAVESGRLQAIPEFKSLEEEKTEDKRLITDAEFARLLEGCAVCRNRILVGFYLRFLRASGCREKEALRVRWEGVDFSGGRVRIGQDGQTKNGQARSVDMNPALRALLEEMKAASQGVSAWLFPNSRRKEGRDYPVKTLKASFYHARTAAGLPWVGFHHLRHYFASHCIMSGVDVMTTAAWLGHRDGGMLVSKVYGHLNDEHKRRMSAKVTFG